MNESLDKFLQEFFNGLDLKATGHSANYETEHFKVTISAGRRDAESLWNMNISVAVKHPIAPKPKS
jgi:hypothetical protein